MRFAFLIGLFLLSGYSVKSQYFNLELLDDTILYGVADPMEPIIFHFEATNQTDSTYHVDFIRVEMDVPNGWEISLCTEACFPPEVSEAVFYLDEMATDEISVYFYPSSPGVGSTKIEVINTQDPSNNFSYELFANATVLDVDELENELRFIHDQVNGRIQIITKRETSEMARVFSSAARLVMEKTVTNGTNEIDVSSLSPGWYVLNIGSQQFTFIR